jgi:CheY-like chemotaxis protein
MTWMVVEDDYAIRDIINTMCEIWQFDVISFKDGFQATAYLDQDEPGEVLPDVALLDIRVPGPWGHEISARIRQHPRLRNIGVILMTAYELPGSDVEEYLRTSGADWILYKPLPSMDDLLHLARQVVEKRRAMEDR